MRCALRKAGATSVEVLGKDLTEEVLAEQKAEGREGGGH